MAEAEDVICVTGSHFVVGELLSKLQPKRQDIAPR